MPEDLSKQLDCFSKQFRKSLTTLKKYNTRSSSSMHCEMRSKRLGMGMNEYLSYLTLTAHIENPSTDRKDICFSFIDSGAASNNP